MSKDKKFTVEGRIIKNNPGEKFSVEVQTEKGTYVVKEAYTAGKMKLNNIRLVVGDKVLIELDCNDLKGRILKRLK